MIECACRVWALIVCASKLGTQTTTSPVVCGAQHLTATISVFPCLQALGNDHRGLEQRYQLVKAQRNKLLAAYQKIAVETGALLVLRVVAADLVHILNSRCTVLMCCCQLRCAGSCAALAGAAWASSHQASYGLASIGCLPLLRPAHGGDANIQLVCMERICMVHRIITMTVID